MSSVWSFAILWRSELQTRKRPRRKHKVSLKPEVSKHYDVIQEQLIEGIIEPVEQGTNSGVDKVYYVPHHEVIYVGKETTKLPVPYDAGA